MREPRSWAADEPTSPAARLTAVAASVEPRQVDLSRWREVSAVASTRPRVDWRAFATFVGAMAVGAMICLAILRPDRAVLHVEPALAQWTIEDRTIRLDAGRLAVRQEAGLPFQIVTPHLTITGSQCRAAAEVTASGTSVVVEEGEVVLRAGKSQWVLHAGQSVTWPPTPNIPSRLEPKADPSVCSGEAPGCLERQSQGEGLGAQTALFELGKLRSREGHSEEAVAAFQDSLRRFPDGVLEPEVRLALLVQLTRARRFAEARAVASQFELRFPEDPRGAEVRQVKAQLEQLGPRAP